MTLEYRCALPSDIAACIELRGKTRENAVSVERLRQLGVTHSSWSTAVANGDLPGYVCLEHRQIMGCSSDPKVRSYGFYRHLGWRSTGTFDANGDEVHELILE